MNCYKRQFTEKFPYIYFVESEFYVISTTVESKYDELCKQIQEKGITKFDRPMLVKLEVAGFTVVKKA